MSHPATLAQGGDKDLPIFQCLMACYLLHRNRKPHAAAHACNPDSLGRSPRSNASCETCYQDCADVRDAALGQHF